MTIASWPSRSLGISRTITPTISGLFVIKPEERMIVNLEYAQGTGDSRGVYLKLGYVW